MISFRKLRLTAACLFSFGFFSAQNLYAWGHAGHQLIGSVAAELASEGGAFWKVNSGTMGILANVPDDNWKSGSTGAAETPTHWFDIDAYTGSPWQVPIVFDSFSKTVAQYGKAKVESHGTASWRSRQFFQLAVAALQAGDFKRALQMAGVMAHYIGDLSQPLHVTVDYDGAAGSSGLHAFFETSNLKTMDTAALTSSVRAKASLLLKDPKFLQSMQGTALQGIHLEIQRSAEKIAQVLDQDEQLGRGTAGAKAQLALAIDRLADGTATLALLLGKIWQQGGRADISTALQVTAPAWVAPAYDLAASLEFGEDE